MARRGITVEGIGELIRAGEKFRSGTGVSAVRPILLDGAETIASAVKGFVPVKTGRMRASVHAVLHRRQNVAAAYVAFNVSRSEKYPYIVESGSAPHSIVARYGGVLRIGNFFARGVMHPGSKGARSFTKGLRASRGAAEAGMVAAVQPMVREAATGAGWEYRP